MVVNRFRQEDKNRYGKLKLWNENPYHVEPQDPVLIHHDPPLVCVKPASLLHHAFPLLALQYSGVVVGPLQRQIERAMPPYPGS